MKKSPLHSLFRWLLPAATPMFLLFAATAHPLQTERFIDEAIDTFAKGDLTTSTLTHDGRVMAPYQRERLSDVEASVVWDVAEREGVRYLATGHEGKLFRQQGEKSAELVHKFEETSLYAIVNAPEGLYIGASPSGKVYRLEDGAEEPEEVAVTGESAIWSLLPHSSGLLIATGADGKILRLGDDGTTSTLVHIPDVQNVLDLVAIPDSEDIAVATQGKGLLLRVRPNGEYGVLIDPNQEEVRRAAVLPDGSIIGAVNGRRSPGERLLRGQDGNARPQPSQQPQPASFIVRAHPDGFVEEWWTAPEVPIHDLYPMDGGSILVAAGNKGRLYVVTPDGKTNHAGVSYEEYLTRLAPAPGGRVLIGTGSTASLYEMDPNKLGPGIYDSRVFDAQGTVQWGRLRALTHYAGGERLTFSTRTGNTEEPDDSWSEWTEAQVLVDGMLNIASPVSRFIQYRVVFDVEGEDTSDSPQVQLVRIFFGRTNVAPRVTEVKVAPPQEQQARGAQQATANGKVDRPPHSAPAQLEVTWKAEDPNNDPLRFDVYLKEVGTGHWMPLEDDLDQPKATFPARIFPDGQYQARVVARDDRGNVPGSGFEVEALSNVFLVDNQPPDLRLLRSERQPDGAIFLRFRAEDEGSLIASASWRLDLGDWQRLIPEDGLMDDHTETFSFTVTPEEAEESRVLTLLVTDEVGNTAIKKVSLVGIE